MPIQGRSGRVGYLAILLVILSLIFSPAIANAAKKKKKIKKSGIRGTIVMKKTGEPVESVYIYAYDTKPATRARTLGIIGITDWLSHGSNADGTYQMDLPPGTYYLTARKRANALNYGPISKGDYIDNKQSGTAIMVRKGKYAKRDFELTMLMEPLFFQGVTAASRITKTSIRGRLLDINGEHIPGTFAMAYDSDDMQRMPDYVSTLTDDKGYYTLYLPKGGRYWLAARFYALKVPREGEPFARYDGSPDHSIEIKVGEFLNGIDMVLEEFDGVPPEGYRPVH